MTILSKVVKTGKEVLSAAILSGIALLSVAQTQSTVPVSGAVSSNPYVQHTRLPRRAQLLYSLDWGVEGLTVKTVESGELIRFSYHVVDAVKAARLNDPKLEPYLVDERAQVKLSVPSLEKVGQLRNKSAPEAGKSYWMAFSNKGRPVKKGDMVTVVIGDFRAVGLVVE